MFLNKFLNISSTVKLTIYEQDILINIFSKLSSEQLLVINNMLCNVIKDVEESQEQYDRGYKIGYRDGYDVAKEEYY